MRDPAQTAFARKLSLYLAGKGVTGENIRNVVRGAIGELGEDPDDFRIIVPVLIVDKRAEFGPGDVHGMLIGFDDAPPLMLNRQALIDARSVTQSVIVSDLIFERRPRQDDPQCW